MDEDVQKSLVRDARAEALRRLHDPAALEPQGDQEGKRRDGFVEAARKVVLALGVAADWGQRVYEDGVVRIVSGSGRELRVTLLANQDGIRNPVVMSDPDGKVYRHHGEYLQCYDHVLSLAAREPHHGES